MASTNPTSLLPCPPTPTQEAAEAPPEDHPHAAAPPPPPTASISLSLSTLLSLSGHKPSAPPVGALPSKVRIPSQISAVSLSSSSAASSSKPSRTATRAAAISAFPLQAPLRYLTRRPAEPSHPAAGRRCTVVWFRSDLRVHDNEALTAASNDSLSLLPVYLFDPRDYGKSSSGFDKTGPYRATFLLESVRDLRNSLRARGSDLVVRVGRPETVLVELAREVGADAVYAHQEVSHDEVRMEEKMAKVMEEEGVEVKYFWGSTLYHMEDLPFDLEHMPSNYGGFREKVQGLGVRKTIEALDQIKGMPRRGDVEPGDIPTLMDLGLTPPSTMGQDGKPASNSGLVGGETEALDRLKRFAAEFQAHPNKGDKDGNCGSIYGANFSCKISPWLAMGCLSPRFMFDELKKTAARTISAASSQVNGGKPGNNGMNWLMFELMWRDFFRFITKKYSSTKKKIEAVPATACTGALV
ncbi:hypothetical protein Taro_034315 [Colocasia esculenta]|uniref:Photolyase/cryptochrome alpha/beta domain-containing protein n=1 Tax=Colocasia esculenta TaxID=4460 RepID=A0A843WF58_COLES|nr:hypothetical protein [Colocasia esculenta]